MAVYILSLPNCLCILMVVDIFTRDATTRVVRETQESLEVAYCRFPRSEAPKETEHCSSIPNLFIHLGNGCSYRKEPGSVDRRSALKNYVAIEEEDGDDIRKRNNMEESADQNNVRVEGDDGRNENEEQITSSLVDSFVISLLVVSAGVSLMEWYRERKRKAEQKQVGEEGEDAVAAAAGNRRYSLADLTVNRHIRRQETQEHPQSLRQVNSRSRPGTKPPPLIRRSSFPAQFPEVRSRQAPQRQQSHPGVHPSRRMSVDLAEDDSSPDRRRVRIIRRH